MDLLNLIIFIALLIICYFSGKAVEKNHYKSIKKREILLIKKPYITFYKKIFDNKKVESIDLVSASVVIGCDVFRTLLANLRNMFGGHVSTFESLMDRGRREALLRMREKAYKLGANVVINVKIDSVMMDYFNTEQKAPKICVLAYGTAIRYEGKK